MIDCCFSGEAPARVLEGSPAPKAPGFPIEALAGRGRIILAGCKAEEQAFEDPGPRHGLLSLALLQTLQEGDRVDLTAAMARIMERVRGTAALLGVAQTPVLFGHIEGGLVLPAFRIGDRYRAAFPESVGARVGAAISELSVFGLSDRLLEEWDKRFGGGGLNALQLAAVNEFRILEGKSLLVIAPTSSGKTFVGALAAARAMREGRKAVFLLPYKALVNEKHDSFDAVYGSGLGLRVIRCTGDRTDQVEVFVRGKYDLGILTYEMFLNLLVANPNVLNQIGLVVLDEAQFITDPTRGITVELLLSFLVAARERGLHPQLVTLSAVIGASNGFEEWLGCEKLVTIERPVPLLEGVLDRSGRYQYLDENGREQIEELLHASEVQMRRDAPSAQDVIVPLVRKLVVQGNEKVIVFRNQKGKAEGCARYLARELGLAPVEEALADLPEADLTSSSADLRVCLGGGTAFHNTNLLRDEKQVVERAFRERGGKLRVLAATTTVAAGINTPASTVILAEQEFIGEDGRPFTIAEYKNMAGRAGRLGFNEKGKAIVLAANAVERDNLFRRYVRGVPEKLASSFDLDELETWIVRLLAQVRRVPTREVVHLLGATYGGFLAARSHPGWRDAMAARLESLLERMLRLGLVEQEGDSVSLTLLGRACGQSSLAVTSAMRLVELLRQAGSACTAMQLLALVQALPEADNGFTPLLKKGSREARWVPLAGTRFGQAIVGLLRKNAHDVYEYWGRCKRAAILGDWISGVPVGDIERTYSATPYQGKITYGDVRRFADATRFHLRAAYQIGSAVFAEFGAQGEEADALAKRLEVGLPGEALGLLELPLILERGDYLQLLRCGAKSVADVRALSEANTHAAIGAAKGKLLRMQLQRDETRLPIS